MSCRKPMMSYTSSLNTNMSSRKPVIVYTLSSNKIFVHKETNDSVDTISSKNHAKKPAVRNPIETDGKAVFPVPCPTILQKLVLEGRSSCEFRFANNCLYQEYSVVSPNIDCSQ